MDFTFEKSGVPFNSTVVIPGDRIAFACRPDDADAMAHITARLLAAGLTDDQAADAMAFHAEAWADQPGDLPPPPENTLPVASEAQRLIEAMRDEGALSPATASAILARLE